MFDRKLVSLFAAAALGLVSGSLPRSARACGGMFCSQPQPNGGLPIAQAGENVLFVLDTDPANGTKRVEAHIQILYTGPAPEFSWIVPVTAVPTVDVGWDILFDRIEPPTRPSFQVMFQVEGTCSDLGGGGPGCAGGASDSATGGGAAGGGSVVNPAVDVLARGSVGPYDYVVVRSEDGGTLRNWLTTNSYFVSEEAARIIDGYVMGGFSFVAVKLRAGVDTSAIRPIILRMYSPEACLPLKLTAIATTPDLRINVWVLGAARAVPINYAELELNLARLDWFNSGQNYDQLIKDAANEAQGNAFAVEYARPSAAGVGWFTLDAGTRASFGSFSDPAAFVAVLGSLGLPPTGEVLKLLRKHIPMPQTLVQQGIPEASFYLNLPSFRSQLGPFDPAALAADLETEVFTPMDRLRPLFENNPYLTRLATFISADEMNRDPLFVTNRTLPDVAPQHVAIGHVLCGDEDYASCAAPVRLQLEDGQHVMFLRTSPCGPFDRGALDQMPASQMAWARDADSSGGLTVDNRKTIRSTLSAHNAEVNSGLDSGCGCGTRGRPRKLASLMLFAIGLAVVLVARRRKRP